MNLPRRDFIGLLAGAGAGLTFRDPLFDQGGVPDLGFATATEALAALEKRAVSAVELTELALDRIQRLNPPLNAVVTVLRDSALARAREADRARGRGRSLGALHGLPVTIKDTFEVAGVRTTAGFEPLRDHVSKEDAGAVARLRSAGAILLGKTNVPPLAGAWESDNPIFGRTNNPWSLDRTPGGSSGGSAAALAAGFGHLSIGSDIGGSIRIPSHWTGIYGHKPTLNLVPFRGHIPPMPGVVSPPGTLAVAGPMARSADDLLLAMRVLGGPEAPESVAYRWTMPPPRQRRLADYRVGYVFDHPACPVLPEVRERLEAVVEALRKTGARVEAGWPDGVDPVAQSTTYLYLVSLAVFGGALDETKFDEVRRRAATGTGIDAAMARAQTDPYKPIAAHEEQRIQARDAWQRYFRGHDVFLLPPAFSAALRHNPSGAPIPVPGGSREIMDLAWWIGFPTLTGCPATVAPIGRTRGGLPVGIQIMGPYLEDATTIDFAARLKGVIGGFERPPGY